MIKHCALAVVVCGGLGACVKAPYARANAMSAEPVEPLGEDRISLHWRFETADRRMEVTPQEFASPLVYADTLYVGSSSGWFFALRAANGTMRWKKQIGSVATSPVMGPGGLLLVGSTDGMMHALDAQTGDEKWHYQSRGPIGQPPVVAGELVVFANEADQVVALEAISGKYKWNYKTETPENFTLRGHAGLLLDGDTLFTGFSNGTLVALRKDTGSVAWSTSLKGDADKFVDVDSTPIMIGDKIYATSSSSGIFALDKATGQIRWRVPFFDAAQPSETGNVGGMATDGKTIYVSVAELGTYAVDLGGNVIWRVGAKEGGEPATPTVWNELLIYSLANDGLFLADRKTGQTVEYFDPGDGVSAPPAIADGRLYIMSNRGILYAFDLD